MAFAMYDRVRETTTTTGTGNVTLAGAVTGYSAFSARYANNDTFYYAIIGQGSSEWEVGLGTYVSATPAVARTTVLSSSNSDAAVSFSAGTKDVFVDFPAYAANKAILTLASQQATTSGTNIDFTGIPSGIKAITIMFDGVSTNGTSVFSVQLGTSGGVETSGYSGGIHIAVSSGANTILTNSSGFQISGSSAADTFTGICNLYLMNSSTNKWAQQSSTFRDSSTDIYNNSSGIKSLSGVLDRVRITSGDTFDLGSINIQYE